MGIGVENCERMAFVDSHVRRAGKSDLIAFEFRRFQRFALGTIDIRRVDHDRGLAVSVFVQQVVGLHQQLSIGRGDTVECDTEHDLGITGFELFDDGRGPRDLAAEVFAIEHDAAFAAVVAAEDVRGPAVDKVVGDLALGPHVEAFVDLAEHPVAHVFHLSGNGIDDLLLHSEQRIGLVGHAEIQKRLFLHVEQPELYVFLGEFLVETFRYGRHVDLAVVAVAVRHLAGVFGHTRVFVLGDAETIERRIGRQRGQRCRVERENRDFVLADSVCGDDVADERIERDAARCDGRGDLRVVIDLEGRKQHVAVHREDVRVRYGDLLRSARFAGDGVGRFDLTLHTASAHAVILIFDRFTRDGLDFPQDCIHRKQRRVDLCDLLGNRRAVDVLFLSRPVLFRRLGGQNRASHRLLGGRRCAAGSHENPAQIVRREPCEEFMKQIRTYSTCADGEQAVEKFVVFHIVGN